MKKLGLVPHNKADHELLSVEWKAETPPKVPPICDNMTGVIAGLDANDRLGDCGPTSADNHRRIKTLRENGKQLDTALVDVLALYSAATDPPFDPVTGANDHGVQMPHLLNAMRKVGLAGDKIIAFGRLKDTSTESIQAAIYTFKAVLFAVDLQDAQKTQRVWEYQPSAEWGGHAVVAGAYSGAVIDVFSWGNRYSTTANFRSRQLLEVWVPIYQSTIDDTQDAVDWDAMSAAFLALTGTALPPATGVTPVLPTQPAAGGDSFPGSTAEIDARIQASATKARLTVPAWLNKHFHSYFR